MCAAHTVISAKMTAVFLSSPSAHPLRITSTSERLMWRRHSACHFLLILPSKASELTLLCFFSCSYVFSFLFFLLKDNGNKASLECCFCFLSSRVRCSKTDHLVRRPQRCSGRTGLGRCLQEVEQESRLHSDRVRRAPSTPTGNRHSDIKAACRCLEAAAPRCHWSLHLLWLAGLLPIQRHRLATRFFHSFRTHRTQGSRV